MLGSIGARGMRRRAARWLAASLPASLAASLAASLPATLAALLLMAHPGLAAAPVIKLITLPFGDSARLRCKAVAAPCATARVTPAAGIVADGAALTLVAAASDTPPATATITVTNEATLVVYDPDIRSYPPAPGSITLTVSGSQIVEYQPGIYILAIEQAPDILKPGPDGGYADYSQPVITTVASPSFPTQALQLQLYPPPVLFLHGLWGDSSSLKAVAANLSKSAPWTGTPSAFLTRFSYQNDAAFDATKIADTVTTQINNIGSTLTADEIAVGRVDVVAHSMGGLVARHFSSLSEYDGPANRTLGAFHQIITINTPESGSELATFLVTNQNAAFSPNASMLAKALVSASCGGATTLGACLANAGQNLAPPGQPITAGAVYSLEPTSPNLAALPSPNIANAVWNASASTVSQKNLMLPGTNALVFQLDELVAATCPGATYCPESTAPIPTVTSVLGTKDNDAVVTLASQTAGCGSGCTSQSLTKLAHTKPVDSLVLKMFGLSYANVLASPAVDSFVCGKLSNVACSAPAPVLQFAGWTPAAAPPSGAAAVGDEGRVAPLEPRQVKPLWITPATAAMGEPFTLKLGVAAAQVKSVHVRQLGANGGFETLEAQLQAGPGQETRAVITPLLMGEVRFLLNAELDRNRFAVTEFTLHVLPPSARPAQFWPDEGSHNAGLRGPLAMHVGNQRVLDPVVILAAAPDQMIHIAPFASFKAIQDDTAPVIALRQDGSFTALREGKAKVAVGLGEFTAAIEVEVRQSAFLMIDR
jgi:hypothetical protein